MLNAVKGKALRLYLQTRRTKQIFAKRDTLSAFVPSRWLWQCGNKQNAYSLLHITHRITGIVKKIQKFAYSVDDTLIVTYMYETHVTKQLIFTVWDHVNSKGFTVLQPFMKNAAGSSNLSPNASSYLVLTVYWATGSIHSLHKRECDCGRSPELTFLSLRVGRNSTRVPHPIVFT